MIRVESTGFTDVRMVVNSVLGDDQFRFIKKNPGGKSEHSWSRFEV